MKPQPYQMTSGAPYVVTKFFFVFMLATICALIHKSWTACFANDQRSLRPRVFPKACRDGVKTNLLGPDGCLTITCSLQQMQRYLYKASLYLYCINNYHSKYYNVSTHRDTRRLSLHELIHSSSFWDRYCRTSRISFHCTLNCWGLSELFFGNSFFWQCKRFDSILKLCLSGWPWPFPARLPLLLSCPPKQST